MPKRSNSKRRAQGRKYFDKSFVKPILSTTPLVRNIPASMNIDKINLAKATTSQGKTAKINQGPVFKITCKKQHERLRRAYFGFRNSRPHAKTGRGNHNNRFTTKGCI
jgi:hypothetical protein